MSGGTGEHRTLRTFVWFGLAGVAVALLLHLHFVSAWQSYLPSVPGYPEAFARGRPPAPFLAASPWSERVGAAVLALAGVAAGWFAGTRFRWAPLGYGAGIVVAHVGIVGASGEFPGNLWPIVLAITLFVTLTPALAGVVVGIGLSSLTHRALRYGSGGKRREG